MYDLLGEKPQCYIVDVFSESAFAGNPLAVVVSEKPLPDRLMQQFAAEMNFSETAFILSLPNNDSSYSMRMFTPSHEVDFAGHPILGAAWVINHCISPSTADSVLLSLNACQISVVFPSSSVDANEVWFAAPEISPGNILSSQEIATDLKLPLGCLDSLLPIQVFSSGTSAVVVPIRDLAFLREVKLSSEAFARLAKKGLPKLVYFFCRQAYQVEHDFHARFFFESDGVREDPATGNAAAFLGCYLFEHHVIHASHFSVSIEQGYEVGRPSLVRLRGSKNNGAMDIRIGGSVTPIVKGHFF